MNQRPPRTFKMITCTEISSIRSATARPTPRRAGGGDHRDRRGGRPLCGRDRSLKGRQHKRGAEEHQRDHRRDRQREVDYVDHAAPPAFLWVCRYSSSAKNLFRARLKCGKSLVMVACDAGLRPEQAKDRELMEHATEIRMRARGPLASVIGSSKARDQPFFGFFMRRLCPLLSAPPSRLFWLLASPDLLQQY